MIYFAEVYHAQGVPEGQTCWALWGDEGTILRVVVGVKLTWQECVEKAPEGMILEFGVREGDSMRQIAEGGRQVYGFDWWKGLPNEWDDGSLKGACVAVKPTDLPDNVELIEGLFSDTLDKFLSTHAQPVAFANIDCDIYTSTIFVLHSLKNRFVEGSIVALSAMTEFKTLDQDRAWKRYLLETGQKWELAGKQHPFGEVWCRVS